VPSIEDFRRSFSFTLGERGIPIMDVLSGKLSLAALGFSMFVNTGSSSEYGLKAYAPPE
jgi:hypothetical protein